MDLQSEAERRRTFAIISHPDAGKTTITEKFPFYSVLSTYGFAGEKSSRHAISDWMQMEQERGDFDHQFRTQFRHSRPNLLDTLDTQLPEDTYRIGGRRFRSCLGSHKG